MDLVLFKNLYWNKYLKNECGWNEYFTCVTCVQNYFSIIISITTQVLWKNRSDLANFFCGRKNSSGHPFLISDFGGAYFLTFCVFTLPFWQKLASSAKAKFSLFSKLKLQYHLANSSLLAKSFSFISCFFSIS